MISKGPGRVLDQIEKLLDIYALNCGNKCGFLP
jgi:hypothetical protein